MTGLFDLGREAVAHCYWCNRGFSTFADNELTAIDMRIGGTREREYEGHPGVYCCKPCHTLRYRMERERIMGRVQEEGGLIRGIWYGDSQTGAWFDSNEWLHMNGGVCEEFYDRAPSILEVRFDQ